MVERHDHACIEVVSEAEAREHLGKYFDREVEESRKREDRLREVERELADGGGLAQRMDEDPVGALQETGVLRPLDQVELRLDVPGRPDFPGRDLDIGIIRCFFVCYFYWEWVCIRILGQLFCFRRLRLICERRCVWG